MRSMFGGEMDFCRPSGASGLVRTSTHGLCRGLYSYAPPGLQRLIVCGSALGLTVLFLAKPVFAFEPMPPVMQKLLEVFPEEDGRFVDEPFGSTAEMPDEARPFFETFRVVVPGPEDIEKNLARLVSASGHLPIRKITRYDKEPGAPGLAGFRGVWCQTEDKDQVGFSIVTINQNRFLIWAKMGYYPAFANDSINPKVRDQYARDVSQYLAGVDMKVPENEAPQASGRGLPEWMGLYVPEEVYERERALAGDWALDREITSWGIYGVSQFTPTSNLVQAIRDSARNELCAPPDLALIQSDYGYYYNPNTLADRRIVSLDSARYDSLDAISGSFAVDRFGRVRIGTKFEHPIAVLFPGSSLLAAGFSSVSRLPEYPRPTDSWNIKLKGDWFMRKAVNESGIPRTSNAHMVGIGHLLRRALTLNESIADSIRPYLKYDISKY